MTVEHHHLQQLRADFEAHKDSIRRIHLRQAEFMEKRHKALTELYGQFTELGDALNDMHREYRQDLENHNNRMIAGFYLVALNHEWNWDEFTERVYDIAESYVRHANVNNLENSLKIDAEEPNDTDS